MREVGPAGRLSVEGYGPGFFRVGGKVHRGAVLVTPDAVAPWGGFADIEAITALAGVIDVVIIGTGPDMQMLPRELRDALDAAGLAYEAMATPPACRSHVVLMDEGRRVALALLPV